MAVGQKPISSEELERRLAALAEHRSQTKAALALGISTGALRHTCFVAKSRNIPIPEYNPPGRTAKAKPEKPKKKQAESYVPAHLGRIDLKINSGIVLVGSDAHIWPGEPTPAMRAFQFVIASMAPEIQAVILNGDIFDGASISRHPPLGWEKRPTVVEELGACQQRLAALRRAARTRMDAIRWVRTVGNHDIRFDTKIVAGIPELEGVLGVSLSDHLPDWECAWSIWINNSVIVKHRFKGGIHAAYNNAKDAGKSMVTGHLHRLQAVPWTDYNGTRWGVETGTLAQPYGPQFNYTEGNPVNWRSGFVILRFRDGELLMPELVLIHDALHWEHQGKIYSAIQ